VESALYGETELAGKPLWRLQDSKGKQKQQLVLSRMMNLYNKTVGMLAIYIDLENITKAMWEFAENRDIFIVEPTGSIVAATDSAWMNRHYGEIGVKEDWLTDGPVMVEWNGQKQWFMYSRFVVNEVSGDEWLLIKAVPVSILSGTMKLRRFQQIAGFIALLLLIGIASALFAKHITGRMRELVYGIGKVKNRQFQYRIAPRGNDEVAYTARAFNEMAGEIDALIKTIYAMQINQKNLEIQKRETQLFALQQQINPHFLFNTLDAVLYGIDNCLPETQTIVSLLAKSFRRVISWKEDMVSLREEMSFICDYLSIQKFRMQERLKWTVELPEEMENLTIPKMLVQPLVENAVSHGVAEKVEGGVVSVKVNNDHGLVLITVADNGPGISQEYLDKFYTQIIPTEISSLESHIGLKSVYGRLHLYYGNDGKMIIDSGIDGTVIELILPPKLMSGQ
jgi:two-component system sensor histidine kinase YesM